MKIRVGILLHIIISRNSCVAHNSSTTPWFHLRPRPIFSAIRKSMPCSQLMSYLVGYHIYIKSTSIAYVSKRIRRKSLSLEVVGTHAPYTTCITSFCGIVKQLPYIIISITYLVVQNFLQYTSFILVPFFFVVNTRKRVSIFSLIYYTIVRN